VAVCFSIGAGILYKYLQKADKLDDIGDGGFFPAKADWIKSVYPTLDSDICRNCKARIFSTCHTYLPDGTPREE
jgi:SulP family sulfate permease